MQKRLFFSLSLIGHIGLATSLPLVILALIGRHLDSRYDTSPKILIFSIIIAAICSFFVLKKIVNGAIEELKELK